MGNAMENWCGMRNFLEQDMLAECLKGRVRWDCIEFPGLESATAFEVYVDDVLAKRFSMERVACVVCGPKKPGEKRDMKLFWEGYWAQKALPMEERCEFDDEDFSLALAEYRCLDAQESIASDDPVVRMFAVLDRRIEKERLEKLAGELDTQPEWLKPYYLLRLEAEGIKTPR